MEAILSRPHVLTVDVFCPVKLQMSINIWRKRFPEVISYVKSQFWLFTIWYW